MLTAIPDGTDVSGPVEGAGGRTRWKEKGERFGRRRAEEGGSDRSLVVARGTALEEHGAYAVRRGSCRVNEGRHLFEEQSIEESPSDGEVEVEEEGPCGFPKVIFGARSSSDGLIDRAGELTVLVHQEREHHEHRDDDA